MFCGPKLLALMLVLLPVNLQDRWATQEKRFAPRVLGGPDALPREISDAQRERSALSPDDGLPFRKDSSQRAIRACASSICSFVIDKG